MNEQATILFNISVSFSGDSAGKVGLSAPPSYLQRLIYAALTRSLYTTEGLELLGRQLAAIARHAYFARQTETMKEASQLMLALPLSRELKSAAQYYQAIGSWKQGSVDEARQMLSYVIDEASSYQAQGLLTVGATYFGQGEFEAALPYYIAAARVAGDRDLQTFATAQKMTAVVRSIYGDHQQALADLERLFPIVRTVAKHHPACYYDFLNSYAIELGEAGRIVEAQNVCAITLASPFATAYPEITQTRDELAAKRTAATPSIIAVTAAVPEIIASSQAQIEPEPTPARARSTISLKLRRYGLLACALTIVPTGTILSLVSAHIILDQLADSTLPRGPPALS